MPLILQFKEHPPVPVQGIINISLPDVSDRPIVEIATNGTMISALHSILISYDLVGVWLAGKHMAGVCELHGAEEYLDKSDKVPRYVFDREEHKFIDILVNVVLD